MKFSDLNLLEVGGTIQQIGAIYQHGPTNQTYLCVFPGESLGDDGPPMPLIMDLGEWEQFIAQSDLCSTLVAVQKQDGTIIKAIVRKTQRQIDSAVQWRVFRRDDLRCVYCWANDVPLTVDHLVTWEDGGPSIEENLVASCKRCNRTRGDMPFADWLASEQYAQRSADAPEMTKQRLRDLLGAIGRIRKVYVRSR
jgi:hypothetical protein